MNATTAFGTIKLEEFSSAALHGEMPDCSDLRLEREEDAEREKQLHCYRKTTAGQRKQTLPLLPVGRERDLLPPDQRGGCLARVVTVSPGPLVRVEGQPVSITCDVKDYSGPPEQDFDWLVSREASGAKIKMISTFDRTYSDALFSKRVASGDVSVVRLQDDEVELKIAEVKLSDAGVYWCQTPSTDSAISGNYEAQVKLTVIPNTLRVSSQTPPPVVPEGSDMTLSCNVTRQLTHPTYLSVTWLVKKGTTSEEILTFGPQGDVVTGPKYTRRYADGGIQLVLGKAGVSKLVISRVTSSDEGIYECKGTEWTHENGKWIKIVESTKEMGTVAVTPTVGTIPPASSSDRTAVLTIVAALSLDVLLLLLMLTTYFVYTRFACCKNTRTGA